jgi:membrane protein required for colicin V production
MNWIDILLTTILIFFMVKGLIRGIVLEVLTLAGMVVAYLVALRQVGWAAAIIAQFIDIPPVAATALGFLLLFIGVIVVFRIVAILLHKIIRHTPVNTLNRGGGVFIGSLKGVLVASLIANLIAILPITDDAFTLKRDHSILLGPIKTVAPLLFNSVKRAIPQTREFSEELQEGLNEALKEIQNKAMKETSDSLEQQINKALDTHATEDEVNKVLESE